MKTHVIVQSLSVCLLLAWSMWDIPATDAGGPPVRLAVERQIDRVGKLVGDDDPAGTARLIPTEWDRAVDLIPTEVDRQQTHWVRNEGDSTITPESMSPLEMRQRMMLTHMLVHGVFGGPPLDEFLDAQILKAPLRSTRAERPYVAVPIFAPWFVRKQPTDLMLGIKPLIPIDFHQGDMILGEKGFRVSTVDDRWIPAEQRWSRVIGSHKWTFYSHSN